jgi:tetratricopeptide (TPR) repeat protein
MARRRKRGTSNVDGDDPKLERLDELDELLRELVRAPRPFGPKVALKPGAAPRFEVLKQLGSGSHGAVWLVRDLLTGADVALKTLNPHLVGLLSQLKKEFRALADLRHENLVSFYEMFITHEHHFFTMEYVPGVTFREWARRDASEDGREIRAAMAQLVRGLAALHRAGKLHRDIKPGNVLIPEGGRLRLLDFGLVTDMDARGRARGERVGTPKYMSPEQALGVPATVASDWYAAGVMLYEALVGQHPLAGEVRPAERDDRAAPPDARPLVPEAKRDLADVAMRLLSREPERRPGAAEILASLGLAPLGAGIGAPWAAGAAAASEEPFVGREAQLRALEEAFGESVRGRAVVALVSGHSGMGKSRLCHRFTAELSREGDGPLVIEARCYERESVPYKALDGFVDGLAAEIGRLPEAERDALAPADGEILGRVFPALRPLFSGEAAGAAPGETRGETPAEARTLRRRAAAALRELVDRLTRRWPLVVHVDDLQWGDADSFDLLAALLSADGPRALWVLSYRSEDEGRSEALLALRTALRAGGARALSHVRRVDVGPLPRAESINLAHQLLGDERARDGGRAEALASEAAGSPIFLAELVRFERERASAEAPAGAPERPTSTLEDLLRARVVALAEPSRRLLALLAVAGRPLPWRLLWPIVEEPGAVLALQDANLVRTSGLREEDTAETYHDRVRELVVALLPQEEQRRTHAALADALRGAAEAGRASQADVEALAFHSLRAGDAATALRFSLAAARHARGLFASRDAARHFETTLSILPLEAADRRDVELEAAEAFRQAGRYDRAIEVLTAALGAAGDDARRAEIRESRGLVFQEKGDAKAAVADLEAALVLLGRRGPPARGRLAIAIAGEALRLGAGSVLEWIRGWANGPANHDGPSRPAIDDRPRGPAIDDGLHGPSIHDEPAGSSIFDRQGSVLLTLMRIYYFLDLGKLAWGGFAAMNLARRSRQDELRALAHANFGAQLLGMGLRRRAALHCQRASALAARSGSRLATGVALGRVGGVALFANDLDHAREALVPSILALKEVSENWELLTSLMLHATAHFLAGRLEAAEEVWKEMAFRADDVGGRMHAAWSRSWTPYVRYLRGAIAAEAARRELEAASAQSRSVPDVANRIAAHGHLAAISVLERDRRRAGREALRLFRLLRGYWVQVPFLQVGLVDAAEAALLALEAPGSARRAGALRAVARRALRRAARMARSYPCLRGPILRVRALEAARAGRPARARALVLGAVELLEKSPNRLWLVSAYRDAAELVAERRDEFRERAAELRRAIGIAAPG